MKSMKHITWVLLLLAASLQTTCEKEVFSPSYADTLKSYYLESTRLGSETLDSINNFVVKVNTPTTSYKQKVLEFLTDNKDLPVLKKIMQLEQLERSDIQQLEEICWKELGSKEDYEKFISRNNMICGDSVGAFIRSQIGIDRHHAMEEFSRFLSGTSLNSLQEEYVKTIITYVCQNGDITLENLVNTEPFSEYEWIDTFGQSFIAVRNFVNKGHQVIA